MADVFLVHGHDAFESRDVSGIPDAIDGLFRWQNKTRLGRCVYLPEHWFLFEYLYSLTRSEYEEQKSTSYGRLMLERWKEDLLEIAMLRHDRPVEVESYRSYDCESTTRDPLILGGLLMACSQVDDVSKRLTDSAKPKPSLNDLLFKWNGAFIRTVK